MTHTLAKIFHGVFEYIREQLYMLLVLDIGEKKFSIFLTFADNRSLEKLMAFISNLYHVGINCSPVQL